MKRIPMRRAAALLACLCLASPLVHTVRAEGVAPLSGPLFGLEIEPAGPDYRLREGAVTHIEGDLDDCQRARLELLEQRHGTGNPNVCSPTWGGKQFWGDVFVGSGWRIQENAFTKHHRLLDPRDERWAWGSYEACRVVFERERIERDLRPRSTHAVVVLHGLVRSKASLSGMMRALAAEGYEVVAVDYPSSRRSIADHADQLALVLDRLEGIERVSFVTHSLGGPVVRTALARPGAWRERLEVGRLVMIFPPSQGSALAEFWGDNPIYEIGAGPAGQELRPAQAGAIPQPTCDFLVVAGGRGDDRGHNSRIPGDDDGTVGVSEARLPGGAFEVFDVRHTFGMNDPQVVDATLRFLASGE